MQCKTTNCKNKSNNLITIDHSCIVTVVNKLDYCIHCYLNISKLVNRLLKFELKIG